MKVLILGVTSNIGYRFYKLNKYKYEIYGICKKWPYDSTKNIIELNVVENIDHITNICRQIKPDFVLNTIGISNIDFCESNQDLALKMNVDYVLKITQILNRQNISVINFSSSMVYDGKKTIYYENDLFNPLNFYGYTKSIADNNLRLNLDKNILIRPTTIIGVKEFWQRDNPISFIVNKIKNNEEIYLAEDVTTNFLFLDDLIQILNYLIENKIYGEFNVGGDEEISFYNLGIKIVDVMKRNVYLKPILFNDLNLKANRPKKLYLSNLKVSNSTNLNFTSIKNSIKMILNESYKDME